MTAHNPIRVYYLASGRLGIHVLDALMHDDRINLVGVGSQPDRPSGRKKALAPTPVAAFAENHGLIVDKVPKVNNEDFLNRLRSLNLDFLVVASFGQILRPALLDIPKYGCFNVHASLLPKYRGASPITQALLMDERQSGISFMNMDPGLDTGPVYRQCTVDITPDDTTDTLENKLGICAADNIADTLTLIVAGLVKATPQNQDEATYAGKIKKTDGAVTWNTTARALECKVRAYCPWPTVYLMIPTMKGQKRIQIVGAEVLPLPDTTIKPGTVIKQDASGILVACAKDAINITRLVPEGRNEMSVADFLRGNQIPPNTVLTDYPVEIKS